jgi:hypothetical protein
VEQATVSPPINIMQHIEDEAPRPKTVTQFMQTVASIRYYGSKLLQMTQPGNVHVRTKNTTQTGDCSIIGW